MFIQTEQTPNPATLKFIPGEPVMHDGMLDIRNKDEATASPLAIKLFGLDGVVRVFYGADFISVTKSDAADWVRLKPFILAAIMEQFLSSQPLVTSRVATSDQAHADESEIVKQIREILDTRVRPAVAQDGGDIAFGSFEKGIVYLQMRGACAGCPSSTATLKMGIERLLRHYIPEVLEVRAATQID